MAKRIQVISGRLIIRYMENPIPIKGITGTNGVLNFLSRSGRFFRSTMIDIQMIINAAKVPMFTSSATSLIGANLGQVP